MNPLLQILSIRHQGFCCQCVLSCPIVLLLDLQSRGPSDAIKGITL